jgi:IS30 family transposase
MAVNVLMLVADIYATSHGGPYISITDLMCFLPPPWVGFILKCNFLISTVVYGWRALMGEQYSQIDFSEHRRIQDMYDAKMPVTAIAEALGRHRSTIHRKLRRNFYHDPFRDRWGKEYKGYFCTSAQKYARDRRSRRRLKLTLKPILRDHIIAKLREGWSPQQIAGRLKVDAPRGETVSHETIYRFIYGPEGKTLNLYALLAVARRRRRKRMGRKPRSSPIPAARSIANRPAEVESRQSFGHWECDLVIFSRQFGKCRRAGHRPGRRPTARRPATARRGGASEEADCRQRLHGRLSKAPVRPASLAAG